MTMRLKVVHRTGYLYDSKVASSFNEARMTPLTDANQTTFAATLKVNPNPWQITYRDYWGATVTGFSLHQGHTRLALTAECTVETHVTSPAPDALRATWADIASQRIADDLSEFLEISPLTEPGGDLRAEAGRLRGQLSPHETALALAGLVEREVRYVVGATAVHTRAEDAWRAREGVCQDMAHLVAGALRTVGMPARYVSGYLHPQADPPINLAVTGESHAWVEWWAGDWYGFDPTNAIPYSDRHVVVARGRDYRDVAPLSGVYAGGPTAAMFVDVDITRIA
ncbi:MAG TPA: transglutaminase family protein [Dermatophilaceae bacterium]|nr:transglutaminase family protein [Dermatophilaceae bacterium]